MLYLFLSEHHAIISCVYVCMYGWMCRMHDSVYFNLSPESILEETWAGSTSFTSDPHECLQIRWLQLHTTQVTFLFWYLSFYYYLSLSLPIRSSLECDKWHQKIRTPDKMRKRNTLGIGLGEKKWITQEEKHEFRTSFTLLFHPEWTSHPYGSLYGRIPRFMAMPLMKLTFVMPTHGFPCSSWWWLWYWLFRMITTARNWCFCLWWQQIFSPDVFCSSILSLTDSSLTITTLFDVLLFFHPSPLLLLLSPYIQVISRRKKDSSDWCL